MTFWDNFDGWMIFSWNFMKFSSGHRKIFKKSSEVTQRCAWYPLTTYFGFRSFWWVFTILTNFLWLALKKKLSLKNLTFFLLKEKNHPTSSWTRTPYTWNFFKIWVWRIISMFRRFRSTCSSIPYTHTEGTKITNTRHKNHDFICILAMSHYSQKPSKSVIFSKIFFSRKSTEKILSNEPYRVS